MHRNVAILVIDSVRKDFFDSWAKRIRKKSEISVEQAYAPSSWSTPSHASMFTGELPSDHGIHTYHRSFNNISSESLFHTQLPHQSVGVSANTFAGSAYDFDQFFDSFLDVNPTRRFPKGIDPVEFSESPLQYISASLHEPNTFASILNGFTGFSHRYWKKIPIAKLVDDTGKAVRRIATTELDKASEPWFFFANFMDAHIPLQHFRGLEKALHDADPSWCSDRYDVWELMTGDYPKYWQTRESIYSSYISYIDKLISGFIDDIQQTTENPTTVIITADHGENHGEQSADGMANHKSSLSEQLLHVPLEIVNPPDNGFPVEGICTLLDLPQLATSIANSEWFNIERETIPAELIGMSAGPEPPNELDREYFTRGIRAAYKEDMKIVWDSLGTTRKYTLDKSTPSEQILVDDEIEIPQWAMDLFSTDIETVVSEARSASADHTVSKAVSTRLEELGYK